MKTFVFEYCVNLDDLDFMGIVSHPTWLVIFERSRTKIFEKEWGLLRSSGIGFVISEANLKYTQPAKYSEKLIIEIEPIGHTPKSVTLRHVAKKENGSTCVEAKISLVAVNSRGVPTDLPSPIFQVLSIKDLG